MSSAGQVTPGPWLRIVTWRTARELAPVWYPHRSAMRWGYIVKRELNLLTIRDSLTNRKHRRRYGEVFYG